MTITDKRADGTLVAAVEGRLDALTAPEFDRWYDGISGSIGPRLVLDLSKLAYVSSAGLRSLLAAAKKAGAAGGRIELCGVTGIVREVLDIAGFLTVFTVFDDQRAALGQPRS